MADAVLDAPAEERAKDPVASIAGQVANLSTGDRAALRRIYLTRSQGAEGVVVGLLTRAGVTVSEREEVFAPWRLLAHVAALLAALRSVVAELWSKTQAPVCVHSSR